jgi:hypothetical protein
MIVTAQLSLSEHKYTDSRISLISYKPSAGLKHGFFGNEVMASTFEAKLPLELRFMIYDLIIPSPDTIERPEDMSDRTEVIAKQQNRHYIVQSTKFRTARRQVHLIDTNILQVHKNTHDEAEAFLYHNHTFVVNVRRLCRICTLNVDGKHRRTADQPSRAFYVEIGDCSVACCWPNIGDLIMSWWIGDSSLIGEHLKRLVLAGWVDDTYLVGQGRSSKYPLEIYLPRSQAFQLGNGSF